MLNQKRFSLRFLLPAVVAVLVVGLLDLQSGAELSFLVFYLLPVSWTAWRLGRRSGVVIAILAGATWLWAELQHATTYQYVWVPYWNMATRLLFFLVTVYLLTELQEARLRRRLFERLFFHDLLNLAGSLRGFAELLQNDELPERRQVVDLLHGAAERIIDEIETQRLVTSVEGGELQVDLEKVSTRSLLETALAIYRLHPCAEGRSLALAATAEEFELQTDPSLMTRILGNLIKNALEATPVGGLVSADCRRRESMVEFRVCNPGVIDPAVRVRLFAPNPSAKGAGRGLGTYSIRLLCEALGGQVGCTSQAETGTVFTVTLPLQIQR